MRFVLRINGEEITPFSISVFPADHPQRDWAIIWYFKFPPDRFPPGVHVVRGEWIWDLDCDCYPDPGRCSALFTEEGRPWTEPCELTLGVTEQ
jgi:hypothetical protein